MSIALIVVAAVVILAVVLALSGNRGAGVAIGACALLVAGGAAFFLLRAPAPVAQVAAVPGPPVPVAAPAIVSTSGPAEDAASRRVVRGRVLKGAEGETPFEGAALKAVLPGAGPADRAAGLASATSGGDGRFEITGLPEGVELRVHASAPGHAAVAASVKADASEPVTLRLVPGVRVAGKVLERETRAPVAGALVSWEDASSALAGADGSFTLEPVPPGNSPLVVRAKGYARRRLMEEVPAGGRADLEILLRPGSAVSGTVLDPGGKPRGGARMSAEVLASLPIVGEMPVPVEIEETRSGADGTFRIEGLPVARKLRISADTEDLLAEPADAGPLEKGIEQEGVVVRLRAGGAVLVTVRDQDGKPLAGASVTAEPAAGDDDGIRLPMMAASIDRGRASAATDAQGLARVAPVEPGPAKAKAVLKDYRSAEMPLLVTAGTETPVTLTLDAGQSISGRVVDEAGAGIAEARVTVQRFSGGGMVHETRTTEADGSFRVGGIDGKGFTVEGEKKGFVATQLAGIDAGAADLVVTLRLGGTIVGTVLDPSRKPLPAFRVVANRKGEGAPSPTNWRRMMASNLGTEFEDPDGKFRIEGLEPGAYALEARSQGFAPGSVEGVAVEAGAETAVEIVVDAGHAVSGVVVRKADGAPVAGAVVRVPGEGIFGDMDFDMGEGDVTGLEDLDVEGADQARGLMGGLAKSQVETGADGRFTLAGLEKGTVRITAKAKGLAPGTARGVQVPASQEVRIELAEEGVVEGVVTDASGAAVEGAMVMLQRLPTFMRFARTDAKGYYRVPGLAGGSYLFYVMQNPGAGAGGFNLKSETVRVEEGRTVRKDHRIGEGTKVKGTVTRAGKPVGGVMVMLFPSSRSGGNMGMLMGGGGGGFSMGSTKEDGTFEIAGVGPGRYTVTVQTGMGGSPSGGDTLEVRAGVAEVRHDVSLPDTGIKGQVVDAGGKPVSGATVMASAAGADVSKITDMGAVMESIGGQAFTDDEGRFALSGMKPGSWTLRVQAQGYTTKVVEGVVAMEGGGPEVRVVLDSGVDVVVRVVGPDGNPVRGAGVFLTDESGREVTNVRQFDAVRTGDDGRATVQAPPGSLRVEAAAAGYAPGSTTAVVPASGEVTVRLAKGASVRVSVKDAGGGAVSGAGVELLDAEGKPFGRHFSMEAFAELLEGAATGNDGVLVRKDLPPGTWKVRAATPDGRTAEQSVTLEEGRTAEITLTLR
jgi:uncharacterized GH25 family protein